MAVTTFGTIGAVLTTGAGVEDDITLLLLLLTGFCCWLPTKAVKLERPTASSSRRGGDDMRLSALSFAVVDTDNELDGAAVDSVGSSE